MRNAINRQMVLVSISALISTPLSAQAQGFDSMLRQYLGSSKATQNPATQNLIRQNISTRQAQIESEITAGVTAGKLTRQEENDLRMELNQIEAQEGQFLSDGNLDNNETQILVDSLTRLTQRMHNYMANRATTGTGNLSTNDWFRRYGGNASNNGGQNQIQRQARLDARQAELSAKIQQGIVGGRLNPSQSVQLQTELNRIATQEHQMLSDGRLGWSEQQQLLSALDQLDNRINQQVSFSGGGRGRWNGGGPGTPGWNGGGIYNGGGGGWNNQSLLKQRIDAGVAQGKLSKFDAKLLNFKEQQLSTMQTRLATAGSSMSYEESRNLNNLTQQLAREINQTLAQKQVW